MNATLNKKDLNCYTKERLNWTNQENKVKKKKKKKKQSDTACSVKWYQQR